METMTSQTDLFVCHKIFSTPVCFIVKAILFSPCRQADTFRSPDKAS